MQKRQRHSCRCHTFDRGNGRIRARHEAIPSIPFHIETIIASQDPERVYFSENTKIGEALIICRRYSDEKKPPTQIINLARNPSTPAEALLVAQIIDNKQIQEHGYGTVQQWPSDWIETGNWNGVQFLQPYLSRQFAALRNSELSPTVQLNSIAEIGPAGQRIRDAFTSLQCQTISQEPPCGTTKPT